MNTRFIKATFVDNGDKIYIDHEASVKVVINALRPDGESKGFDGEVNQDGTVTVPLHSWMLELVGTVTCDISVIDTETYDNKKLTTTSFTLLVEKAAYGGDDITSDPQYDVLVQLLETCSTAGEVAEEALQKSNEALERAEGVRGIYVGSGDMPEGYNVQIDLNGEVVTIDKEVTKGSQNPVASNAVAVALEQISEEVSQKANASETIRIYKSITDLGFDIGKETIEAIANAMVIQSMLVVPIYQNNANIYPDPKKYGSLEVICYDTSRIVFQYTDKVEGKRWIGSYSNTNAGAKWTGWKHLATADREKILTDYSDADGAKLFAALDEKLLTMGNGDSVEIGFVSDPFLGNQDFAGTLHKLGAIAAFDGVSIRYGTKLILQKDSYGKWNVGREMVSKLLWKGTETVKQGYKTEISVPNISDYKIISVDGVLYNLENYNEVMPFENAYQQVNGYAHPYFVNNRIEMQTRDGMPVMSVLSRYIELQENNKIVLYNGYNDDGVVRSSYTIKAIGFSGGGNVVTSDLVYGDLTISEIIGIC